MVNFRASAQLWHTVHESTQLWRLLKLRAASQFSDGLFQAGLAGALLFNPDRAADPWAIAGAFTVLFLPYSLVGPFAGALLDRWNRRSVLVITNLMRFILVGIMAGQLSTNTNDIAILCTALLANGLTRFVSAGLAAALPDVVAGKQVVTMNSVAVATGAIAVFLGMNFMLILRHTIGENDQAAAWIILLVTLPLLIAFILSWRFPPHVLGPAYNIKPVTHSVFYTVITGLGSGMKAISTHREVAGPFIGLIAHRMTTGINTLLILTLVHHGDSHSVAGFATTALFIAVAGIGSFLATLLTPTIVRHLGRYIATNSALASAILIQFVTISLYQPILIICSFFLGITGQIIKLCTDTAIQVDIDDTLRGHVFAIQDSLFWISFVGTMTLAAIFIPNDGKSVLLISMGALLYIIGLITQIFLKYTHKYHKK